MFRRIERNKKRTPRQIPWDSHCSKKQKLPVEPGMRSGMETAAPFLSGSACASPFPFRSLMQWILFNGYQKRILLLNVWLEVEERANQTNRSLHPLPTRGCMCHLLHRSLQCLQCCAAVTSLVKSRTTEPGFL